jgi:hypothetical protein
VQYLYFEEIDEGVAAVMEVHIGTSSGVDAASVYIKVQCPGKYDEYQFLFNSPPVIGKVRGRG